MTPDPLATFEREGLRFRIEGDRLRVRAPSQPSAAILERVKAQKADIMAACRVRDFVELVIHYGTSYGRSLDAGRIAAELDEADRAELATTPIEDRQSWAELLAYRLTRSAARLPGHGAG